MRRILTIIFTLLLCMSVTGCTIAEYTEADMESAKDTAYEDGYNEGYDEGYDTGYEEGYDSGIYDSEESNDEGYLGPAPSSGRVYVTRTGSKYHQSWCQYIQGKNDLSYYNSAGEAESAGYDACSVCY